LAKLTARYLSGDYGYCQCLEDIVQQQGLCHLPTKVDTNFLLPDRLIA
jgi:hypothetical protein